MKIGILQTGHLPEQIQAVTGNYDRVFGTLLAAHDLGSVTYPVVDGVFPDSIKAADGWLITGSKHGAYEDHDWIPPLEDFIREVHAARRPLVGICFGHQIIAQALGGRVEKFAGGWSVGRQSYDFRGKVQTVNAWHQDQVVAPPPGSQVVASSAFCANAGFVIGDHIMTVQAHPEFSTELVSGLLKHRAPGVVPEALIEQATATLAAPNDSAAVFAALVDVLKSGAPAHV